MTNNDSYRDIALLGKPPGLRPIARSQIEELVSLLLSIVQGIWRYRWPAISVAWGVCLAGWFYVSTLPDIYQASARVFIDAESMIKRLVGDLTISEDMMTEINVLARIMLSRPQLEKTASQAGLNQFAQTPEEHERVIEDLRTQITLSREGGENIFRMSYTNSDRVTAERVVRILLDNFVADALGERRTDSGEAAAFLELQITEYESRLDEAEEKLATFQKENIGLMPGAAGDYFTRLQSAITRQEQIKAELHLARQRLAEYARQLGGEEPVFGIMTPRSNPGAATGLDAQIAEYENARNELLLRYTENHPDVVALTQTIDRLKAQRDAEPSLQVSLPSVADPLDLNPVYQRMKTGESETRVEIVTLENKLRAADSEVNELQQRVDTLPEIERQLGALNRDYNVMKQTYETFLQKRESLRITGEVEETGDQLQFREIDPPQAPLTPIGPNRPRLFAATAVAAIGLGLALAFLLQQLNPVFTNRRELRELTGLPVLGLVSFLASAEDRSLVRRRALLFVGVFGALPIGLGLAILLQDHIHRAVAGVF